MKFAQNDFVVSRAGRRGNGQPFLCFGVIEAHFKTVRPGGRVGGQDECVAAWHGEAHGPAIGIKQEAGERGIDLPVPPAGGNMEKMDKQGVVVIDGAPGLPGQRKRYSLTGVKGLRMRLMIHQQNGTGKFSPDG